MLSQIYNNKEAQQIHFHSQRSHTITNMNDNINMNSTIARPMNKNEGESESAAFLYYCRFYICITIRDTFIKRERLWCHFPVKPRYIPVIVIRQDTNFQPHISWLFVSSMI
jgi:hypothetical protein